MRCIMLGAITRKHHKCHMLIGSYMYAFTRQYNLFWQISYSIRLVSKVTIYPLSLTLHPFCGRWWSVLFPLHWNSKVFGEAVISLWVICLYGVRFWIEYKSCIRLSDFDRIPKNVLAFKKSGGKEEEQKGEPSVRFQNQGVVRFEIIKHYMLANTDTVIFNENL